MVGGERIIETAEGARIRVRVSGHGPAVIFLHGIGGNAGQWDEIVHGVADGAATVAWDARGYGGSQGPEITRFAAFAEDLIAVIEALELGPVLGVGHSMGARILIEAACLRPDVFAALLLSGAQPAYLAHLSPDERAGYVARRLGMFEDGKVTPGKARQVAREVLPPGADEALVARLAADFTQLRPEGYGAALRASAGWDRGADLAGIGLPVEVVGGGLDPICPPAQTRALAHAVAAERVTVLQGVAHMMQLEAPETVTDLVAGFVARHGARAAQADFTAGAEV